MLKRLKHYIREVAGISNQVSVLSKQVGEVRSLVSNDLTSSKVNLGQILGQMNNQKQSIGNLSEVEFKVFSQVGDDGIIQYLVNKLDIPNKTFIEFGVETYTESNTRFLLINNNWSGFVLDGSKENIDYIKNDYIHWLHELNARHAFITAENINELLGNTGFDKEVGILSIDIDGNDYWIWKAIECISPVIVIIEYNSVFGKNTAWTVPYDPSFVRQQKHSSFLYFGASLKALEELGKQKGYSLIGSNSMGLNAYFVRNDRIGNFSRKSVEEAYVCSKFREAQVDGERVSGANRIKLIEGLDVIDTITGESLKIDSSLVQY